MTSLIDVVFLLLLFFMLTSTFSRYAQTEITPPANGSATNAQRDAVLAKPMADGWLINGSFVSDDNLTAAMNTYRQKGAERVVLGVNDALNTQRFVDALETLRAMGLQVAVSR